MFFYNLVLLCGNILIELNDKYIWYIVFNNNSIINNNVYIICIWDIDVQVFFYLVYLIVFLNWLYGNNDQIFKIRLRKKKKVKKKKKNVIFNN